MASVVKTELYLISMAARLLDMHPQTLRKYERLGLVRPSRTMGSMRVYSGDELKRLRLIKQLVDGAGINLAGVERLLAIVEVVERMPPLMASGKPRRRNAAHRRLSAEIDELFRILGLESPR